MPDGSPLQPELFQFTPEEMSLAPELLTMLTPPHVSQNRYSTLPYPSSSSSSSASSSDHASALGVSQSAEDYSNLTAPTNSKMG